MTLTVTQYKAETRKTWPRIAAELTEHAMARDPDKMNRIFEGRLYALLRGKRAYGWEVVALEDLCGSGATYRGEL